MPFVVHGLMITMLPLKVDAVTAALNSLTHLTEVVIAEETLEEPDSDTRPVRYAITAAP